MDEQYNERKARLSENLVVKRPITRLDSDVLPQSTKRNKVHKMTPKKMLGGINSYFKHCEEHDEVPSISGMMIHMKLYRFAFQHYIKDARYTEMLEQARLIIKTWVETDIYNTKGLAAGKIKYAENVHGWSSKIESTNTQIQVDLTPDQARARIEALAPKLLEVLKNNTVLNQLVKQDEPKLIDVTPKEKENG